MKAYALDLRERVVKFIQDGGSKAEAARQLAVARSSVYRYLDAAKKGALAPKQSWGHWRKLDPPKTPGARQKTPRRHAQRAATSVWRQPSRGLGAAGSTGLHSKKKLIKYRERNEAQRWLFRRELEKLARRPVFYLDECGGDHRLYREYGRAPRGERIYQAVAGKRRERTSIISASQQGKLVAPLVFQGSCNTEVVDAYFEQVLLPELPPGSVIVLDNARFHQSPTTQKLVEAAGCQL